MHISPAGFMPRHSALRPDAVADGGAGAARRPGRVGGRPGRGHALLRPRRHLQMLAQSVALLVPAFGT